MRLLSISAELPPFNFGGYEVGAWRVSYALRDWCGVETYLLTSMRGVETGIHLGEKYCYRLLPRPGYRIVGDQYIPHNDLALVRQQKHLALQLMQEVVELTQPDVVLFWQVFAGSLYSLEIFNYLKQKRIPAYLYSSNIELPWLHVVLPKDLVVAKRWRKLYSYTRMHLGSWRRGQALEIVPLDWSKVAFCSAWLKHKHIELGYPAQPSKCLNWGVDVGAFQPTGLLTMDSTLPLKIVWAGRIYRDKGLHVLIEALKQLPAHSYTLDIYGHEQDKVYAEDLRKQIIGAAMDTFVNFKGFVQMNELRDRMPEYDVFVLSSIWEEPFSLAVLEAAAAGLALVSTLTGGTLEILSEKNALIYDAEDAYQLSSCLKQLSEDPLRLEHLKKLSFETVKNFTLEKMVQEIYTWMFK